MARPWRTARSLFIALSVAVAFVGTDGRCQARGFLELHHAIPFADGGETTAANLQLRCRAHNAYEAEQWFELTAIDQSPGQV